MSDKFRTMLAETLAPVGFVPAEEVAKARADALEEAAKTCDAVAREARANVSQCDQIAADVADRLAAAIRALRGDG